MQAAGRIAAGEETSRMKRRVSPALALTAMLLLLAGCAHQAAEVVSQAPDTPGFLLGLWQGFIFPWDWIGSLFDPRIAVYAVPNNGGWYDFGYFLGITLLGGGSWFGSKRGRRS
jgi:hypothetical protein